MQMEISGALASLRAAFDLAKVAVEARDDAKIKVAMGEMAERFTDLQIKASSMAEALFNLQSKLNDALAKNADIEQQLRKRQLHVLSEIRPGAYVYTYNPLPGDQTAPHYKCQICFDAGKDSVLVKSLDGNYFSCNIDRSHGIVMGMPNQGFFGNHVGR